MLIAAFLQAVMENICCPWVEKEHSDSTPKIKIKHEWMRHVKKLTIALILLVRFSLLLILGQQTLNEHLLHARRCARCWG